jgi:hypothetical protein
MFAVPKPLLLDKQRIWFHLDEASSSGMRNSRASSLTRMTRTVMEGHHPLGAVRHHPAA